MRVGLPRALLFHQYGDCWVSFLEELGFEPVVTGETTGDTVVAGSVHADNETCLPVKVFTGHLLNLRDGADVILVPRVISQRRGMTACPKYLGLPDMARALQVDLPPVMSPVMDLADRRRRWAGEWRSLARDLGASDHAATGAVNTMLARLARLRTTPRRVTTSSGLTIGIAGHLYNVHDQGVSLGLLDRVRSMGAEVVTVEDVPSRHVRRQLRTLPRRIKWDFERRIVGAALHWNSSRSVSGIVHLSSFACGPGSMIGALLEDEFSRRDSLPLMTIILDEHSAEGGMVTRIEAFIDMLKRAAPPAGSRPARGAGVDAP